jgi:signal transduction histidine kinase
LNRQNQELKILTLKNKVLEGYFLSEDLQQGLDRAIQEFNMVGCSSVRILVQQHVPFNIGRTMEATSGEFAQDYAYLDKQIVQQLQDKEQLIINDTTKVHSIKFTPDRRYPKAIGAFRFLKTNDISGYFWISFEAVKEFSDYEIENLTRYGAVLTSICANASRLADGKDSAAAFEQMLTMVDVPILLVSSDKKILFENSSAKKTFNSGMEDIFDNATMSDWLASSQKEIHLEIEILDRHYQIKGQKLAGAAFTSEAVLILHDDTTFNHKQAYLTLMMDTINHDFRGPLVNMQGFSKLLGMVGELNPKQSEYLELIQDGIDEIATVTTDLLDVNRMIHEGGLKVQECAPKELVEKALTLIQAEARQKQVAFDKHLTTEERTISVDRIMVVSALYHLLNQTVHNSHLGGSILVEEHLTGEYWYITIQDAGRGISQIDIDNLVANHFADKNSPGLSLVYRIARFHQGDLQVESELGKGSKFILQLKCCD